MNWLKQNWKQVGLGIIILGIFVFINSEDKWSKNLPNTTNHSSTNLNIKEKSRPLFEVEDKKILSSKPEELNDEEICTNIGYLLVSYCGSGGCSLSQSLEEWIGKAQETLRLRGVTAYEYKDSDINCSETVVGRIDNIFETAKKQ